MAQRLPAARESVRYYDSWTLSSAQLQGAVDITGYSFALDLTRQMGAAPDISLRMAATELGDGFAIASGPALMLTIRILPGTLGAVGDTTGDFELFGDLIATPPAGESFLVADLILPVTKGPTVP